MKIKKFFNTPKKTFLTIISLIAVFAILSTGTAFAASAIAQNSSIGAENAVASAQITLEKAKEIALSDAKLTEDRITFTTAKLDIEDNLSVYEIEFYSENVEYEYEINVNTGAVYSKSKEIQNEQKPAASTAQQPAKSVNTEDTANAKQNNADSKNDAKPATNKQQAASNQITLDAAKAKALADAGVTASGVTYTEAKLEYDDGIAVYDIEFYTSTNEYEYKISATSGTVYDKSIESLENDTNDKQNKTDKAVNKDKSSTYIGIDKAKAIAVNHAGLSMSGVTFSKAKLDTDDGNTIYDIEFYKDGIEYEYEIDASSGKILEYDAEHDD